MIDADFCSGVDAVLAFPEFNQPGSATIVEVDRQSVEDHLKTWRHIVIEPGVAGGFLPRVNGGGKKAAAAVVCVAEGDCQFF